jgi:hypothetical protein
MEPVRNIKQLIRLVLVLGLISFLSISLLAQRGKKNDASIPESITMSSTTAGTDIQFTFLSGTQHNHPTFAIWLEDEKGNLLETLFVTRSIATGIFKYADAGDGTWSEESGESIRPAALPYWAHKRNVISRDTLYVPTPENPVPDAVTGATPAGSFTLNTKADLSKRESFVILMEINQTWDWDNYWTNNKYPDDKDYKSSAQPSVIYAAKIDLSGTDETFELNPIGHGHYSGKDGNLYPDLTTLSTALEIAASIQVTINN